MTIHALLKKALTLGTRLRIAEILLTGHPILANAHNIHIAVLQLRCVSKLLDAIPLCMNRILAVAASATATAETVRSDTENLAAMHKHSKMKACAITLSQTACVRILQKTIEQGIMPLPSGLNTGRHIVHKRWRCNHNHLSRFQFYAWVSTVL